MKLIGYLSNGYPTLEESRKRAQHYVKHGVDIIEADFPAKDPYLDSDFLKKRIFKALENESDYSKYMENILQIKKENPTAGILVNIYEETIKEIGIGKFVEFMKKLDENQVLLVGKEYPEIRKELEKLGFYASSYVTRAMLEEDLELAKNGNGFVYMQGFGDEKEYSEKYPTLKDCVEKVREIIGDRKIYVGVGVHTPELLKEVYEAGADGVFLGKIILTKEDDLEEQGKFIQQLRRIADGKE